MSNKKEQLLNESTVRRFMGLAGIGALSNNFVDEKQLINEGDPDPGEAALAKITGGASKGALKKVGDIEKKAEKVQEQEEGMPPEEEMAPPMPEDEMPVDAEEGLPGDPVEDVDLTEEEAEVLIGLGRKLEAEMGGEEEGLEPGPEAEAAMPPGPEEMAMGEPAPEELAENLIRTLTSRVANRIKKEHVVNEVMRRVAKRLSPRRKR